MSSGFDFEYAFEAKLIKEIQKHPLIYDFAVEEYKNTKVKEVAWNKISFKVCGNESSTIKCKKKWRHLRDMYKRCKRRKERLIGQKKPVKVWKHERIMRFLDKSIDMKKLAKRPFEDIETNFDDDSSISEHNNESLSPIDDIKAEDSIVGQSPSTAENFNAETLNADSYNDGELNEESMSVVSSTSSAASRASDNIKLRRAPPKWKTNERHSLSLLFESLDNKIHQANLSEDQMTDIESSVFSLVFFKLNNYNKMNKVNKN